MVALALAMTGFGLFLLLIAVIVVNAQRRSRSQLGRLQDQVGRVEQAQLSPAQKAANQKAIEAIEAQKREIHGRFDSGGC